MKCAKIKNHAAGIGACRRIAREIKQLTKIFSERYRCRVEEAGRKAREICRPSSSREYAHRPSQKQAKEMLHDMPAPRAKCALVAMPRNARSTCLTDTATCSVAKFATFEPCASETSRKPAGATTWHHVKNEGAELRNEFSPASNVIASKNE